MPPSRIRMSEDLAGPPSPTPSLIDLKAETRLVLKSFLRNSLSVPLSDRPGRIGGAYRDPNKFSVLLKDKQKKDDSGWDSLDEKISAAEEKKHDIKNLIKIRLRPRSRHSRKESGNEPTLNGSADKQGAPSAARRGAGGLPPNPEFVVQEVKSSASEDESEQKIEEKKKKKNKLKLPEIFRKKSTKKDEVRPVRPGSLPLDKDVQHPKPLLSPTHPPEFYDGVADKLDRIAQRTVRRKSPTNPKALEPKENKENKEAIVQQLVHLLTMEGDAMNEKIEANPFLRSSLNRLSYASFAKLLDTYANETVEPPLPAPGSPTLRRVAITMEVTRRVVTATGVPQRVEGYAERYMENFSPWLKSQGGWESIAQMEAQEFD